MINFDDTSIAFKSKTNRSLKKAYWLFKLIGIPILVKIGKPVMNFSLRIKLPIKGLIKASIFDQFCGGETVNECSDIIRTKARDQDDDKVASMLKAASVDIQDHFEV